MSDISAPCLFSAFLCTSRVNRIFYLCLFFRWSISNYSQYFLLFFLPCQRSIQNANWISSKRVRCHGGMIISNTQRRSYSSESLECMEAPPLLPAPLWSRVVVPVRVHSMGLFQISKMIFNTFIKRRCPWCNGYRRKKWTRRHEFKYWTRLIAFPIALIPLGKVWIQLFSLQLWVNSWADYFSFG